jgi:hypothetical protein
VSTEHSDTTAVAERLTELTQELLDAHCDTVCLARDLSTAPAWLAHMQYLKDLQRVGKRTLSELADAGYEKPRTRVAVRHVRRPQLGALARALTFLSASSGARESTAS